MRAAARELVSMFYKENPGYLFTPENLEGIYRQMLHLIADDLDASSPRNDEK